MPYSEPTFNLDVLIWDGPRTYPDEQPPDYRVWDPVTWEPRIKTVGNLAFGKRVGTFAVSAELWQNSGVAPMMQLLLPKETDVRNWQNLGSGTLPDMIEVPAHSGRIYSLWWFDDVGKGFANEYRIAGITQWSNDAAYFDKRFITYHWPIPTP